MSGAPLRGELGSGSNSDSTETSSDGPKLSTEPPRLDRYVLIEQIGRGSFATVWAAYDPQLDRRVAIKLLGPGRAGAEAQQLAEAQALARLSHPHVVAVHDVQTITTPELGERVFIVMEFLAGVSLREWMTSPHDWREVLAVFGEAGRGLAAAHAHGLVHRDFKPGNVMFGADGRVRVLDFGLARASSGPHKERSRIAGTPAYMAPEQHLGEAVDARSDQFAFCTALYEALYGERPFSGRDRTTLGKAKLRGEILPPPRTSSVPAWVFALVQRGLAVNPDHRFADMDALLVALAHDPGLARRRWLVGLGLAVLLIGASIGVVGLLGSKPSPPACPASERELVGVWDDTIRTHVRRSFMATELPHAEAAFSRVERALDAHTDEWTRLHREVCEATMVRHEQTVEEMAEQTLCLQRRLRRIAGLTTTLERVDASTLARAGDAVLVLEPPARCRERVTPKPRDQLDGGRRSGMLEIEGEIAQAGVLTQLGRYEEAITVAHGAIDHALELADAGGAGRAWLAQTRALWYLGRYEEAIAASEQAMRWAVEVGDRETQAMAQIRLIRSYVSMGKYEVAEAVAKLVKVQVEGGRLGAELEAWYDHHVAILHTKQLRWDEALARLEHGLALRIQLYGPDHPELAPFHNTWGNALLKQGHYDDALVHYHEALRLWESNFGPEYPDVASVINNIGAIHLERGEGELARPYLERALASYELAVGPKSPQLIPPLANLGEIAAGQGRLGDALALFERARAIAGAAFKDDNVNTAHLDYEIAAIHFALGDVERAELLVVRTLEIQRRDGPEDLPELVDQSELLAECQSARGQLGAWRTTLERLLAELGETELGGLRTAIAPYLRAQLARSQNDYATARTLAEQHLTALVAELDEHHEQVARQSWLLLELLIDAGEFEAAATRARDTLEHARMDPGDRARWQLEYLLGRAEVGRGRPEAAIAAFEQALERCSGADGNPRCAAQVRAALDGLRR